MHCDKRRVCHHYLFTKKSQLEKIQQLTDQDCNSPGSCHAFASKFLGMFYRLKLNFISRFIVFIISGSKEMYKNWMHKEKGFQLFPFQILNPVQVPFLSRWKLQSWFCSMSDPVLSADCLSLPVPLLQRLEFYESGLHFDEVHKAETKVFTWLYIILINDIAEAFKVGVACRFYFLEDYIVSTTLALTETVNSGTSCNKRIYSTCKNLLN